jgi:hypothetical protein
MRWIRRSGSLMPLHRPAPSTTTESSLSLAFLTILPYTPSIRGPNGG